MASSAFQLSQPPAQVGKESQFEAKEHDKQSVAYILMQGLLNDFDEAEVEGRQVDPEVLSRELSPSELVQHEVQAFDEGATEHLNAPNPKFAETLAKVEAAGYKLSSLDSLFVSEGIGRVPRSGASV